MKLLSLLALSAPILSGCSEFASHRTLSDERVVGLFEGMDRRIVRAEESTKDVRACIAAIIIALESEQLCNKDGLSRLKERVEKLSQSQAGHAEDLRQLREASLDAKHVVDAIALKKQAIREDLDREWQDATDHQRGNGQ